MQIEQLLAQLDGSPLARDALLVCAVLIVALVAYWVAKRVVDEATLSEVAALSGAERIDELARMLAGDRVTEEARAAARALLVA